MNYKEIGENHRLRKVKPFVNQYDWTDINFPTNDGECKKFESNNKSISLNISYVPEDEETIRLPYKSKYNLKRENKVNLLIISDGEKGII